MIGLGRKGLDSAVLYLFIYLKHERVSNFLFIIISREAKKYIMIPISTNKNTRTEYELPKENGR